MLDIRNLKCGYCARFSLPFRFSSVHIWLHKSRPYKCQSWNDMRTKERERTHIVCICYDIRFTNLYRRALSTRTVCLCRRLLSDMFSRHYKYKLQSFPISVRIAGAVQKLHFSKTLTHTRAHSSVLGIWRSFRCCHFFLPEIVMMRDWKTSERHCHRVIVDRMLLIISLSFEHS